jgi:hypothetical protein
MEKGVTIVSFLSVSGINIHVTLFLALEHFSFVKNDDGDDSDKDDWVLV